MDNIYSHLTDDDLANELWKPINGYPSYMISSCGRVKSLERLVQNGNGFRTMPERILNPRKDRDGYLRINLYKNSTIKRYSLHRLVATHFIENPEGKPEVNHLTGKTDNRIVSLEWCTREENMQHAWTNGLCDAVREASRTANTGENHGAHKLKDYEVNEIRARYQAGGITQKALGKEYGISQRQLWRIVNNKSRSRPTPANDEHKIAA